MNLGHLVPRCLATSSGSGSDTCPSYYFSRVVIVPSLPCCLNACRVWTCLEYHTSLQSRWFILLHAVPHAVGPDAYHPADEQAVFMWRICFMVLGELRTGRIPFASRSSLVSRGRNGRPVDHDVVRVLFQLPLLIVRRVLLSHVQPYMAYALVLIASWPLYAAK